MRFHRDTRRTFYADIFATEGGDINLIYLQCQVPIAWHRHERQDDGIFVVSGTLKVQTIDPDGTRSLHYLSAAAGRRPLRIPRRW